MKKKGKIKNRENLKGAYKMTFPSFYLMVFINENGWLVTDR